jgi:hypothetical protein
MKTLVWGIVLIFILMMYTVREGMEGPTPVEILKGLPDWVKKGFTMKEVKDKSPPYRTDVKNAISKLLTENTSLLREDMKVADAIKKLESTRAIETPLN